MQGQVSRNSEAVTALRNAGAHKRGRRKLRDIKEIGAFQVTVSCGNSCIHGVDVDRYVDAGFGDVGFVDNDRAADIAKVPADLGQAHVKDGKVDPAMRLVWDPRGGLRGRKGSSQCQNSNE